MTHDSSFVRLTADHSGAGPPRLAKARKVCYDRLVAPMPAVHFGDCLLLAAVASLRWSGAFTRFLAEAEDKIARRARLFRVDQVEAIWGFCK